MKYESYTVRSSNSFLLYDFISEGPKGPVKKVVRYDDISNTFFILGFGDDHDGVLDLKARTNNKDTKKVLATVGSTLYEFFKEYPYATVQFYGDSASRTRLYRIEISNNLDLLQEDFTIFGMIDGAEFPFERNTYFDGFKISKKTI